MKTMKGKTCEEKTEKDEWDKDRKMLGKKRGDKRGMREEREDV